LPSFIILLIAWKSKIATASFIIPSPNIIEYKFGKSFSFIKVYTPTVSVAVKAAANYKPSVSAKSGKAPRLANKSMKQKNPKNVIKVPTHPNQNI